MNCARSHLISGTNLTPQRTATQTERWWESGWFWLLLAVASTIPLWWPTIPPLVDLPGHLGRYRVELDRANSLSLRRYFDFHWAVIGNVGVDVLIIPLAPIFGLEGAVKLIAIAIPALTVGGIYLLAREVHGRPSPAALFGVPFAYNFPFNFGFLNFALSMALTLAALAGWLQVSRTRKLRLRAAVFIPASCILWFVHVFGWAVLLLMAWSAELDRRHQSGMSYVKSVVRAAIDCLILCVPFLMMIIWRSAAPEAGTDGFFGFNLKAYSIAAALRDRWSLWDTASVAIVAALAIAPAFQRRLEFSRKLATPVVALLIVFLLMPAYIFGSAYADSRLAPFMLIVAVVAVAFRSVDDTEAMSVLAMTGLAFLLLRLAGTTVSFAVADRDIRTESAALDHVPEGARVLSLVGASCNTEWELPRHWHLGSLIIERKLGFSNDQWELSGTQLLQIHYPSAGDFATDPSELVFSSACIDPAVKSHRRDEGTLRRKAELVKNARYTRRLTDLAIVQFPRWAFDYLWIIKAPGFNMRAKRGLSPIWRSSDSVLYRIDHETTPDQGVPP